MYQLFLLLFFSWAVRATTFDYSRSTDNLKRDLIKELYKIEAIQIKNVHLKSGLLTPLYFDMRIVISHYEILGLLTHLMRERVSESAFDLICGVPYGAIPLTTAIAIFGKYPMIMLRKEAKGYGNKKLIEGVFKKGDSCALIEDVITTGSSIMESIEKLESEGLTIKDIFVVIDREQDGIAHVQKYGYKVHALFTVSEVLQILFDENIISHEQCNAIKQGYYA